MVLFIKISQISELLRSILDSRFSIRSPGSNLFLFFFVLDSSFRFFTDSLVEKLQSLEKESIVTGLRWNNWKELSLPLLVVEINLLLKVSAQVQLSLLTFILYDSRLTLIVLSFISFSLSHRTCNSCATSILHALCFSTGKSTFRCRKYKEGL